ncbi:MULTISPECIES: DUF1684 domain-containing protein [unclassified Flavobacterium]|uniref:DUF1684 domain-containing protein n=1 Tax=unclassified Flavobacterium TaxID=196869 RepID=UPI0012927264|nr:MULTISPECIES: DUF1684 domain-containing protein [unclassified Flavobacterium]MQP52568.1 DUF1684 domain-containing protein [Flavobacterium sp. LMO9]MQP62638.1 DUF1684 domain-containing protein [Flavobacterium sp. LMO6]
MNKILLFLLYSSFALAQNDLALAEKFQLELNKSYADSLKSPLTKEDFKHFKGLDFYPISEKYIVQATFIRTKKEKPFGMKTTTSRTPLYVKYGELHFSIEGKDFKLNVYQNKDLIKKPGYADYLFLPFSDLTCGKESYIGGRYVDMRIQKGKIWTINFNKAYNPYCAYNYEYSCPIVPLENDLNIEILAGVKKFHD